ncbi:MAG: sodium:solute symporter [Pirellulales bacterium]|nr:sodium:solute symporter [Pirellulales bacterium]
MQQLPTADVVVLLLYLAGVVGFGCWFVRRSRTTEGFMAAGRSLPGWAVGLSIFGTYLSSNTFIGVPGKAYGSNFNSYVFSLSLPIAALIAVRVFVPFYRRSGEISAYHHLENRFGGWARTFAVVCYLLMQVARIGSIMLGVALGLHALVGWDMTVIIVATGALVTLYTLLGGIEAVIWTDVAQSIVLTVGAAALTGMLLFDMPGGPQAVFERAHAAGKFSLGSFGPDLTQTTFWVVLVYGLVMNLNNFGIDQSFVQRYHTARSDREAARSVWLGGLLYLPISLVFFFIGAALFAYYNHEDAEHRTMLQAVRQQVAAERLTEQGLEPGQPTYAARLAETAAALAAADVGDKVLPHFIVNKLPGGMAGLLIAAIFAAAMSSIDTSLNSSATIVLSDVYKRYLRPEAAERESMHVLHVATLMFGALGTGLAVALIGVKSVLDAWWLLSGIFVGGMLGLFLLGLVSRLATNVGAVVGVIAGVLVTGGIVCLLVAPESWQWPSSPLNKLLIPVAGTTTIVLVGLLVSLLAGHSGPPARPPRGG